MDEIYSMIKRPFNGTWEGVESDKAAFENIMIRLPVKSILMFKSISKFWYNLMSTKHFIILHRHLSKKKAKFLAIYDASDLEDGLLRKMHLMEPNGTYSELYMIPGFEALPNPLIISSFNGLICCISDVTPRTVYDMELRIYNPATREVLVLPRSHLSVYMPLFGVLYSNIYNIYKIFKFFIHPIDVELGYSQCEVYSSRTGKWELLGMVPTHPLMNPKRSLVPDHVCINEKLYWCAADEESFNVASSILIVDMDYNFREIPLPTDAEIPFLIEFQGRLCFVDWTGFNFYIWLYDEEKESWYLKDIPAFPGNWLDVAEFDSVVAHKHEILFVYKDVTGLRHEILYDVLYATWKVFSIHEDDKNKAIAVLPFFETLASFSEFYVFALD